jgi:hypothetical protein
LSVFVKLMPSTEPGHRGRRSQTRHSSMACRKSGPRECRSENGDRVEDRDISCLREKPLSSARI